MIKKITAGITSLAICAAAAAFSINSLPIYAEETTETAAETETTETEETTLPFSDGTVYQCENDDLTWSFDGETLTIGGEGICYNYHRPDEVPWYEIRSNIKNVVVNEGVTTIGKYMFNNFTSLESVTLPETITKICYKAFANCISLENLVLPESVTEFDEGAFCVCTSLKEIIIPKNVTAINAYSFQNCYALEKVDIQSDVLTRIGSSTFVNCTSLKSITIPDSVTLISSSSFENCTSLVSVSLGSGITKLEPSTFAGCQNLESVTYTGDLISIGSNCFLNNMTLSEFTIPENIESIGANAFKNCYSLYIPVMPDPETVEIGTDAFLNCGQKIKNPDAESVFSIGNVYVTADQIEDVIYVPVKIKGNKSFGRARINISYNSFLTYVDTVPDKMGWIYMESTRPLGTTILGECFTEDDGNLAYLKFKLPLNASAGSKYDIYITSFELEDETDTTYEGYGAVGGTIKVVGESDILPLDINHDGAEDTNDLLSLNNYILGKDVYIDKSRSDLLPEDLSENVINVKDLVILKARIGAQNS